MKKIFTLAIAALAALSANAQTTETLALKIDAYPWNYTADPGADITLTFDSQWGEYGLIGSSNAINPADYKGYKIEYEPFAATASETDGYVQASIGDKQYNDFATDATVLEQDFNDDVKGLTSLTKFNIQGKAKGAKIHIKSFTLIKNDGTEEPVTSYVAGGWGRTLAPATAPKITYTGQYGGLEIVTPEGESCTYSHETQKETVYLYTIALNEVTTQPIMVELDDANGGFVWNNYDAGVDKLEFTISDAAAVQYADDGTATSKDVAKIYLKANGSDGYPFTVDVKSITRVVSTVTGISSVKTADKTLDANSPMYNLAGQRVNNSYKGVVIQNGHKFINK